MGALKHLRPRLWAVAIGLALAQTTTASVTAEVATKVLDGDLDRLKSLATTLRLEREASDAIRGKDGRALISIAAGLKKTDAAIFAVLPKVETRAGKEKLALALKLGACHYAGLTLRSAIVAMADGRTPARVRLTYIDSTPPVVTDQFAAHMQRCELIERAAPSVRLIGSSCLIDGRHCRESER